MTRNLLLLSIISITVLHKAHLPRQQPLNANSWSIGIGKKILLCSWKNNRMGDTATIRLDKLQPTDSFYVAEYWCGYDCRNASTTLSIRDTTGKSIKQATRKNDQVGPYGAIQLATILAAPGFSKGQVFDVYMDVTMGKEHFNRLIARIRVE